MKKLLNLLNSGLEKGLRERDYRSWFWHRSEIKALRKEVRLYGERDGLDSYKQLRAILKEELERKSGYLLVDLSHEQRLNVLRPVFELLALA